MRARRSFSAAGGIEASNLDPTSAVHGTVCAEVVHDVAPDAQLYLVNFYTDVEFLNAVDWLIAHGVDVISLSVGWVNAGPYDGTGDICDAINEAHSSGIVVAVSAGNQAKRHYQGIFTDADGDGVHEYSPGDEGIRIYAYAGDQIDVFLSWSAPWPTHEDYDLYLLNSAHNLVSGSTTDQAIVGGDPVEGLSYSVSTSGYYLAVQKYSTTADWDREIFSFGHDFITHDVLDGSLMIPGDAEGAMTLGAVYWRSSGIESFSSRVPQTTAGSNPIWHRLTGYPAPYMGRSTGRRRQPRTRQGPRPCCCRVDPSRRMWFRAP